ncbi:MAG TPA: DUF6266 family protein [Flavobacterium sp.]|nr:DUF6266 family protein [Flavobacterium sp.]
MATYEKGILGAFTGTVGTVVGANWRGKNVMRSRPKKTTSVPTEAQIMQRERFATVTRFLTPIRGVYNRYFGQNLGSRSRYNMATSYHMTEAVEWVNDRFEIIYNKVLISKGELQGMQDGRISPLAGNQLQITWSDNSGQGLAIPEDSLLVVIYCPDLNLFEIFENSAVREDTEATLNVPAYFAGMQIYCWASFVNDVRKQAASSSFLEQVGLM